MAEYNAKLHVKTSTGYDDINLQTKAEIVEFNKGSSGLTSTNVNAAITEVNTKANTNKTAINTNKTAIGTLSSLATSAKTNLVSAINEVYNKFSSYVLKSDIINNLVSTNTDKPLSANMGRELETKYNELNSAYTLISAEESKTVNLTGKETDWKTIPLSSGLYLLEVGIQLQEDSLNARNYLAMYHSSSGMQPVADIYNGVYNITSYVSAIIQVSHSDNVRLAYANHVLCKLSYRIYKLK